ncbi:MAG: phosphotransferase [Propionibacteriaceae bacterium]|nr:phosphotransferase [Propionibacteriaceae bacterium]
MSTTELWRQRLAQARWFQGKGLAIESVELRPLPWYVAEGEVRVRSELADVVLSGRTDTYHLLVGYLPAGQGEPEALIGQTWSPERGMVDVVDAPASRQAMRALLHGLIANPPTGLTWNDEPPDPDARTTMFTGEQSNTTVQIGQSTLLKIFRRLSPGASLEATTLAALSDSGITARLIGTLSWPEGPYDLAVFSQRVLDATDGWDFCVEACGADRSITAEMTGLGSTLRELHQALATRFPTATTDVAEISAQMLTRLDTACDQVPELRDIRDDLIAILDLPSHPARIQRVHGDFHLGQALVSPTGWTIIDFEGEPLKSLEERSALDTVWRDVAGATRSLDYARSHHRFPASDQAKRWHDEARSGFLGGYLDGAELPSGLLTAYEVDKAIYELVYELRNRPSWAPIPRRAIHEAIQRHRGGA